MISGPWIVSTAWLLKNLIERAHSNQGNNGIEIELKTEKLLQGKKFKTIIFPWLFTIPGLSTPLNRLHGSFELECHSARHWIDRSDDTPHHPTPLICLCPSKFEVQMALKMEISIVWSLRRWQPVQQKDSITTEIANVNLCLAMFKQTCRNM